MHEYTTAVCRDFPVTPLGAKGIKFTAYAHHYKSLPRNIFGAHFEKQDGSRGHFFDGHQGVFHIPRLFLIHEKLNPFMVDMFNRYT